MKNLYIYVHIPYCASKCSYCNFVSFTKAEHTMSDYVDAVIAEIKMHSGIKDDYKVCGIYIGGGTPSVLCEGGIKSIVNAIKENFNVTAQAEITIEANPKTLSEKSVKEYLSCGINRYSIGLQSANNKLLKTMGRKHTAQDFVASVALLRSNNIENISADIMLGVPNQTMADVESTVKLLLKLKIPHISAYGLRIEKGTKLYKKIENGEMSTDEDLAVDMYDRVVEMLESEKIYRYEVSNFAKVGYECNHNLNYWRRGEYLGIGVSAHGFLNEYRTSNVNTIDKYIELIKQNCLPENTKERINIDEAEFEYIMLNLRTEKGMDIDKFNQIFYTDFIKKYQTVLTALEKRGALVYDEHTLNIKSGKIYVLNSILVEFMR